MSPLDAIPFHQPLPLFPLGNCVLMPSVVVPLHIFEPRYRQMMQHVLDTHGLIAMALFEGEDYKKNYEGNPPIRRCVCVGQVVKHECLPDGRYNLMLRGEARASIEEETAFDSEQQLFRQAYLEPLPVMHETDEDLFEYRQRFHELMCDCELKKLASVGALANWNDDSVPSDVFFDLAAMALCRSSEDRYRLLAEPDAVMRAKWLCDYVHQTCKTLKAAAKQSKCKSADGLGLN